MFVIFFRPSCMCIWLHFSMQVKVAFLWTRNLSHRQVYEQVLRIVVFNDCELFFKNLLQKDASISTDLRNLENLQQRCKVSKISKYQKYISPSNDWATPVNKYSFTIHRTVLFASSKSKRCFLWPREYIVSQFNYMANATI